ncbi:MAG: tetratricopeptide repeat protein [Bacteroidota bacterium]
MRYFFCLLVLFVALYGCKSSFKSNWTNFTAHYNTYYNAQLNYEIGERKNLDQSRPYNELLPIRVHKIPVNAGGGDFEKAIEKGADVLRKFEDSKWVDDALQLIGKSYYFRREYFSADQKFLELYTSSNNEVLRQNAIVWRTRTLLELELYGEGVRYINEQLAEIGEDWTKSNRAEAEVLLAQHYVAQENWPLASQHLKIGVGDLPRKDLKERGFFLLGQLYERQDSLKQALDAYERVGKHFTEYELQYLANKKKAELARKTGDMKKAYNVYYSMSRDDKNNDVRHELEYELGRTLQLNGEIEEAREVYYEVLHGKLSNPDNITRAKTYYGLAEIYRYSYDDFYQAAAYYDSAAGMNIPIEDTPESFNAEDLSESFGAYAQAKREIFTQDSLLYLGSLSPSEFDSVLNTIKEQRLQELEQQRRLAEQQQNTLVNIDQDVSGPQQGGINNGFLNYRSPQLVANARRQFIAIWGDRPLVDGWRFASLIKNTPLEVDDQDSLSAGNTVQQGRGAEQITIDLSRIPFTPVAKDSVRNLIAAQKYELGNLFFLSLELPDSAKHYFEEVYISYPESDVWDVALYSLSELNFVNGFERVAEDYAVELIEKSPNTRYAERLAQRFDLERVTTSVNELDTLRVYTTLSSESGFTISEKADSLTFFASSYSQHPIAPKALYDAIQLYVQQASAEDGFIEQFQVWREVNDRYTSELANLTALKDSAKTQLADTTLTDEQSAYFRSVSDSTIEKPDLYPIFPYRGALWDTTRSRIQLYQSMFSRSDYTSKIQILRDEFTEPDPPVVVPDSSQIDTLEQVQSASDSLNTVIGADGTSYVDCNGLEIALEIRGGKPAFLADIEVPSWVAGSQAITMSYRFRINERGLIREFTQTSDIRAKDLVSAVERAIKEDLVFEPILIQGSAVAVQCEEEFVITATE